MQPVEHRALAPQHLALRPIVSNGLPVEIAQFFLGGHPPLISLSSDSVWTYIHPAFPEGAEETGVYPEVGRTLSVTASPCHLSQRERQVGLPDEWAAFFRSSESNLRPPLGSPFGGAVWPKARLRGLPLSRFSCQGSASEKSSWSIRHRTNPPAI